MTFDIHQLDELEYDESEEIMDEYWDTLIELFRDSPEGQEQAKVDPDVGLWARQFMYFGYTYLGVPLPRMSWHHVQEIVTDLFPRKISLLSPDEADDTIPELIAFWEYLKREYAFPNADDILRYLHKIEPDFKNIMNDPSKFGMAKSFVMMGQEMGFDMTTEEGINAFMNVYNKGIMSGKIDPGRPSVFGFGGLSPGRQRVPKAKRQARKRTRGSRRENRRKRKKRR